MTDKGLVQDIVDGIVKAFKEEENENNIQKNQQRGQNEQRKS